MPTAIGTSAGHSAGFLTGISAGNLAGNSAGKLAGPSIWKFVIENPGPDWVGCDFLPGQTPAQPTGFMAY